MPAYLIIKQTYDIGLFPAVPMLVSYDLPVRAEYWKNLGDKGNYLAYIVYYHPTMQLTARGEAFRKAYQGQFKEGRYTAPLTPTSRLSCWQTPSTRPRATRALLSSKSFWTTRLKGGTGPSASRVARVPTGNSGVLPCCLPNTPGRSSRLPR